MKSTLKDLHLENEFSFTISTKTKKNILMDTNRTVSAKNSSAADDDPSPRMVEALDHLRQCNILTDCFVRADDGTSFPAHRAVLSTFSPFLLKLFEGATGQTFTLNGLNGRSLKCFLNLVYCHSVEDIYDTPALCSLLEWTMTHGSSHENLIADSLVKSLNLSNCLHIVEWFSKLMPNSNWFHYAFWFILRNFDSISDLTKVSEKLMISFISHELLSSKSESKVLESIVSWQSANSGSTSTDLWETLRYGLLPLKSYLQFSKSIPEHISSQISRCYEKMLPDFSKLNSPENFKLEDYKFRPRLTGPYLFAFGGWVNGGCTDSIEIFDSKVGKWLNFATPLPFGVRAYQKTLPLNHIFYFVGGFDGKDHASSCFTFNALNGVFAPIASMNRKRCYVSACTVNGKIYALGGCDRARRLSCGEVYDPQSNQWTELPANMSAKRSDAGCAAIKGEENTLASIIICGGFDGDECLETAEMLNLSDQTWSPLSPMSTQRSGLSVCYLAGYVYAIGGFDGNERLRSVERFDLVRRRWETVAPMSSERSNFSASVFNNKIYVCGGYAGDSTIANCEFYDPSTNTWTEIEPMVSERSALSCCVLFGDDETWPECSVDLDLFEDLAKIQKQIEKYAFQRTRLELSIDHKLLEK